MRTPEQRKPARTFFDMGPIMRIAMVGLMVVLQMVLGLVFLQVLRTHAVILYAIMEIACAVIMIYFLAFNDRGGAYKYAWVIVVMLLGVFGLLLYVFWGRTTMTNKLDKRLKQYLDKGQTCRPQDEEVLAAFEAEGDCADLRIGHYLGRQGFRIYAHTASSFYPLGEDAFVAMHADLEAATESIYLEFFIIFEGKVWEDIFAILARKAGEGLDVRVLYDDMGSLNNSTGAFLRRMRNAGIRAEVFNPVHQHINQMYMNYRDHRKIMVIDQRIAYTGGINLADEYANLYEKHGHWKDTAVRLEGPGVEAFTRFYLVMWNAVCNLPLRSGLDTVFVPPPHPEQRGFVIPFEDGPHNNPNNPAEVLYRQMIAGAQRTLYITTPYLVVDDIMVDALVTAAASGVDVRLIIPMKPDHWYVHWTSLSFAGSLLMGGVRIFRYTPGFIHAKMVSVDEDQCVVGTVNMDYRSFFLHYECGVWFQGGDMPGLVRTDIEAVLAQSEELTLAEWKKRPLYVKIVQPILRIFAPLM